MKKKYGAVQDELGQWQLCYYGAGGPMALCYGGVDSEHHYHGTAREAQCCAIALTRITDQYYPEKFEEPLEHPSCAAISETETEAVSVELEYDDEGYEVCKEPEDV